MINELSCSIIVQHLPKRGTLTSLHFDWHAHQVLRSKYPASEKSKQFPADLTAHGTILANRENRGRPAKYKKDDGLWYYCEEGKYCFLGDEGALHGGNATHKCYRQTDEPDPDSVVLGEHIGQPDLPYDSNNEGNDDIVGQKERREDDGEKPNDTKQDGNDEPDDNGEREGRHEQGRNQEQDSKQKQDSTRPRT